MNALSFVTTQTNWNVTPLPCDSSAVVAGRQLAAEMLAYVANTGDVVQIAKTIIDMPIIPDSTSFTFIECLIDSNGGDPEKVAREFALLKNQMYHALRLLGDAS